MIRSDACRSLVVLAVLLAAAVMPACTSKSSDKSLVMVTVPEGQRLAAGEHSLLGKKKAATWVDARTTADYDTGHIADAVSLPFEHVTLDYYLVKDAPIIIVYGSDYNDARANGMSKRLMELLEGHDIRTLDGGVKAWTAAGNELVKSPAAPAATQPH